MPLVLTQIEDPVATLTLNHPQKRNALSIGLIDDLIAGLQTAAAARVRVAILRAAEGVSVWSAGHDIGTGRWSLCYRDTQGDPRRKTIDCCNTEKVITATFHLADISFPAKGESFDFFIEAERVDATISFVRVVTQTD